MNKKLVSIITMTTIMFTSVSPVFAKNFTSKQNVALTHAWTVKFNKTLGSNQDFSKVIIKNSNGNVVPVNVVIGLDKQSVTVAPTKNYDANTNYTLTVDGIKDSSRKALSDNAVMQFTTTSNAAEDTAISPQAVTFNKNGSVTPLTTNEYVDKAFPGLGYPTVGYPKNPKYNENFGMKNSDGNTPEGCFINSNNEFSVMNDLNGQRNTFSQGYQYNKYMKEQMRELFKGFIGTTPYDNSHYLDTYEDKESDGINDVVVFDYREIVEKGNSCLMNFTYYFPVKPIKNITDEKLLDNEQRSETWKHAKDNANLVLEVDNTKILDAGTVTTTNFKESLYSCFGVNYANKILNFMLQERQKARDNDGTWDGNDTIMIGNMTIYSTYHGHYYSFFFK